MLTIVISISSLACKVIVYVVKRACLLITVIKNDDLMAKPHLGFP